MKRILAAIFAALMLWGCGPDEPKTGPDTEPETARRTIIIYMEAKNNLAANAEQDIREIRQAAVPADCRLLVFSSTYGSVPRLYERVDTGLVVRRTYPATVSAVDPRQLHTVLADAATLAPARERGLVMWSHGFGWVQNNPFRRVASRAFGYENGLHVMSNTQIAEALEGADIDFIYFDACFMASIEVAYELRNSARWMVASPTETPAPGMPYDITLPDLFNEDLGQGLIDAINSTADYYDANPEAHGGCPRALTLVDLRAIDALAAETKRIFSGGTDTPAGFEPQPMAASGIYAGIYFDMRQYLRALGADARWEAAFADAVAYERHSAKIWNALPLAECGGLSIFIPNSKYDYTSFDYPTLAWAKFLN